MEQLAELLFVLGSMDRLELLSKIRLKKCRLGELSAKISATPQETSRHLMRLRDAMLIEKDSTGLFGLTALGEIVLTLLPSMNFLALHKDYFMSHEVMSRLPHELVRRIGELQESIYLEKVGSVLALAQKVVQEAEEYIWLMADHILQGDQFLVGSNKLETSNVAWKIIVPAESNIDWNLLRRTVGINKGKMEFFLLEDPKDVCAAIAMNEKIAGLSFPDAKGRLDFNGAFTSENPLFIRWCQDLFLVHRNKKGRIIKL